MIRLKISIVRSMLGWISHAICPRVTVSNGLVAEVTERYQTFGVASLAIIYGIHRRTPLYWDCRLLIRGISWGWRNPWHKLSGRSSRLSSTNEATVLPSELWLLFWCSTEWGYYMCLRFPFQILAGSAGLVLEGFTRRQRRVVQMMLMLVRLVSHYWI